MNSESMDKAIETYIEKEYVTKALNVKKDMQKQITGLMNDNKTLNGKIIDIRKQITSLQQEAEAKAPTIAHLKYLAALLHTSNDNAIIIFIVMIMMVFDTLAMYLMITSDWIKIVTGQYVEKPRKIVQTKYVEPKTIQEELNQLNVVPAVVEETKPIIEEPKNKVLNHLNNINEKQPSENKLKTFVNKIISKKETNNIDNKVSNLVKLLLKDESIIDKSSFIKSLSMTPLIVEKLEQELGKDSNIMKKINAKLKR